MSKRFSFASWNVEHFNGEPERVGRVVGLLAEQDPDIFAIYEVAGRDVYTALMDFMPTHAFTITESVGPIQILVVGAAQHPVIRHAINVRNCRARWQHSGLVRSRPFAPMVRTIRSFFCT
jgi:hypothetical protein